MQTCSVTRGAGLALAALLAFGAGAEQKKLPDLKPEQSAEVKALIGNALTAKPEKARKVLVFYRTEGFVHGEAIVLGNEAFRIAAEQTKAFSVDFSEDYAALKAENLAKYDALVLNNTTTLNTKANPFISPALLSFVREGKGFVVIHAGADNFNDAHELAEMIGGHFWGHPWGAGGTWAFKLDDPANAVNAPFDGKSFKQGDEIYMQESPYYNRAKLHVLVSLDFSDPATAGAQGQRRADKDYAVSWIRPYGKGRVFYTSFCHDARAWLAKPTLFHILNGLQYALGDLKADDTPAGFTDADIQRIKVNPEQTEVYEEALNTVSVLCCPKLRKANADKLAALLADSGTTPGAKRGILRAFQAFGAPDDLAGVSACIAVPEARDAAITLIAQTRTPAASEALNAAWGHATPDVRCSLLNAFAIRGDSDALLRHVADPDGDVANAAILALGRVADAKALAFLAKPQDNAEKNSIRQMALSNCIGTMTDRKQFDIVRDAANAVFADTKQPSTLRAVAARAILLGNGGFFKTALLDGDPIVRQTVIRDAANVSGGDLTEALAAATHSRDKAAIMSRLAASKDRGAAEAVKACLASPDEEVVVAALGALESLGGKDDVEAIIPFLDKQGLVAETAFQTLQDMPAAGVGEKLFKLAVKDQKLIPILGERMESALLPEWKTVIASDNADVRKDAWKALGKNATPETFPTLCGWFANVKSDEANAAANAVRAAAKNASPAVRVETIGKAWAKSSDSARPQLMELMSAYADPAFLKTLTSELTDDNSKFRNEAANALGSWNSMEPFDTLKASYASAKNDDQKRMVLRAALNLAMMKAGGDFDAKAVELFKIATDGDRGRVADTLFRVDSFKAFPVLKGLFADSACGAAAKKAYVALYDKQLKGNATANAGKELSDRGKWKASASHNSREARNAFDGNKDSRWSSNTPSVPGMWFVLDLGENAFVSELMLDTEGSSRDTPNGWQAYVSQDGKNWGEPVSHGNGDTVGKTAIPIGQAARQIKIVTTDGRPGLHWSIHEITIKGGLDPKAVEDIAQTANSIR